MKRIIAIITLLALCLCTLTGCREQDGTISISEAQDDIVRVAVFQDGVCTEMDVNDLKGDGLEAVQWIARKEKALATLDMSIDETTENVELYLKNELEEDPADIHLFERLSMLDTSKVYVYVEFGEPHSISTGARYYKHTLKDCGGFLISREESVVYWFVGEKYVGSLGIVN